MLTRGGSSLSRGWEQNASSSLLLSFRDFAKHKVSSRLHL